MYVVSKSFPSLWPVNFIHAICVTEIFPCVVFKTHKFCLYALLLFYFLMFCCSQGSIKGTNFECTVWQMFMDIYIRINPCKCHSDQDIKISSTPEASFVSFPRPNTLFPLTPHTQTATTLQPDISFVCSSTSYKWNHRLCTLAV